MKYIFRLNIILGISLLGEFLGAVIPLPVPGSIYGLVLMLAGLCTGIIPLASVEAPGRFLIDIIPVMFIPAVVGIINSWAEFSAMLVPAVIIVMVSTFLVMGVTGRVTQAVMRREKKGKGDAE